MDYILANVMQATSIIKGGLEVDRNKLGIIITSISAAGFGSMAIFAKIAYAHGSNVTTLLSIRFITAGLLFLLIMKLSKTSWGLNRKQLAYLIALGAAGYGVLSNLFFAGVALIPASVASLLLYTYPTMVCILAYLIGDEKMYPQKVLALLISAVGITLVLGPSFESLEIMGVIYVLSAAVLFAFYFVLSNKVLKEVHWLPSSTIVSLSAAVFFIVGGGITGQIQYSISTVAFLCAMGIALFSTVLAIGGLYAGISMIGPSRAAIVSTLEPIVTVSLAAIIFAEVLSKEQLLGGALIVISIIVLQISRQKVWQAKRLVVEREEGESQ